MLNSSYCTPTYHEQMNGIPDIDDIRALHFPPDARLIIVLDPDMKVNASDMRRTGTAASLAVYLGHFVGPSCPLIEQRLSTPPPSTVGASLSDVRERLIILLHVLTLEPHSTTNV